ncbi:MAG TPA: hypothetical protein VGC41_28070, partial [Kofleriaceae bacterium]
LRPRIHIPAHLRTAMLIATPALIAAWALAGFYGSLGPMLVKKLLGSQSHLVGGIALGILAASGAIAVFILRARSARYLMTFGTIALVSGVAFTLAAIPAGSAALFFTGAVIAGCGFGGAFQGAIRSVIPQAAAHERAGVLSIIYIVAYVAMGAPAVVGGVRLVHTHDVFRTAAEYGIAVILLALAALAGSLSSSRARALA